MCCSGDDGHVLSEHRKPAVHDSPQWVASGGDFSQGTHAASDEFARRAADQDKLTGLPNHAKTLELLDLALAERASDDVTTFALIELDGMADVNAQLGVLGSDELTVAVARRLKQALPATPS